MEGRDIVDPQEKREENELEMAHHIMQGGGEGAKHEVESTTLSTILENRWRKHH